MAKKPSKAPSKKSATKAKGAKVLPEVKEFLRLVTTDRKIQSRFKGANVRLLPLARGLGYSFSKSQLMAGVRESSGSAKSDVGPNTCTFVGDSD